jgi:hypothetical protein
MICIFADYSLFIWFLSFFHNFLFVYWFFEAVAG